MIDLDLQYKQIEFGKKFFVSYSHELEINRKDLDTFEDDQLTDKVVETCLKGFQPRLKEDEWEDIKSLQYYMKFAEAVYGWSQYVFANPYELFNVY